MTLGPRVIASPRLDSTKASLNKSGRKHSEGISPRSLSSQSDTWIGIIPGFQWTFFCLQSKERDGEQGMNEPFANFPVRLGNKSHQGLFND